MKSTLSLHSLIHLSNLCDEITFRQMPEEEDSTLKKATKYGAASAVGAGALYGANRGVDYIKSNYGGPGVPFKDSASAAAGDVMNRVKKTKVGNATNIAWRRSSGQNVVKRVGRAAMSGIRSIFHEDMTPAEKIIALDAKLVEFSDRKRWASGDFTTDEIQKLQAAAQRGDNIGKKTTPYIKGATGAVMAAGGYLGHREIKRRGGYKAVGNAAMNQGRAAGGRARAAYSEGVDVMTAAGRKGARKYAGAAIKGARAIFKK